MNYYFMHINIYLLKCFDEQTMKKTERSFNIVIIGECFVFILLYCFVKILLITKYETVLYFNA